MYFVQTQIFFTFCLSAILTALLIFPIQAASDIIETIEDDIQSWRLEDARAKINALSMNVKSHPKTLYLEGRLLFFEGEYSRSLETLRKAIEGNKTDLGWKQFRDQVEESTRVFESMAKETGISERFVYRYSSDFDKILISYAESALTTQLQILSEIFTDNPKCTIEIAFLPNIESLSAVSGLSQEQIEKTGTVGITKYARIMIISPQSLLNGYPWLDTLAHELTHLIVTRVSKDRAPIWFQEGIAKMLESRWRSDKSQELVPEEAYLLDRALKEGRLIPLRRFHPSLAYLPDQEDAASAYAQVLAFMKYLDVRMPKNWIRYVLDELSKEVSIDTALKSLGAADLQRYYGWWKKWAAGKQHTPSPTINLMKRRFKRGRIIIEDTEESLQNLEIKRYLRVGDLLRLRGHTRAAIEQFDKALKSTQYLSVEINDRLASALLEIGEYKRATEVLLPIVNLYPFHVPALIKLARSYVELNEIENAVNSLKQANSVNPFNPEIHCMLAEFYQELDLPTAAELESENCKTSLIMQKMDS